MKIDALWLTAFSGEVRLLRVGLDVTIVAGSDNLAPFVVDRGFNRLFFLHASTYRDEWGIQFDTDEYPLMLALFDAHIPCSQYIFAQ